MSLFRLALFNGFLLLDQLLGSCLFLLCCLLHFLVHFLLSVGHQHLAQLLLLLLKIPLDFLVFGLFVGPRKHRLLDLFSGLGCRLSWGFSSFLALGDRLVLFLRVRELLRVTFTLIRTGVNVALSLGSLSSVLVSGVFFLELFLIVARVITEGRPSNVLFNASQGVDFSLSIGQVTFLFIVNEG